MVKLFQPFHLVTISPWPLVVSFSIFNIFTSIIFWFNFGNFFWVFLNLLMVVFILFQWWRDIVRESTFQGFHTFGVLSGLKMGMVLFIISEVFFFVSIFWAYFHMFLSPSIEIGGMWPPVNIIPFNPYSIPLLNTVILLSSGVSISWCHYSILKMNSTGSLFGLSITIILGFIFSFFQFEEYLSASFTWSDSVYGACFFLATGFHGFHVLVGTLFLLVNFFRLLKNNFSSIHHFGFEAAAWYWHFVDVVWLFLFIMIYLWSF
uniref:Cytochrome c oxidase subunit 3 n=1 Tax=Psyllaephagus populi TaxID=3122998 RepID=A0AAU7BNI0_9HYME